MIKFDISKYKLEEKYYNHLNSTMLENKTLQDNFDNLIKSEPYKNIFEAISLKVLILSKQEELFKLIEKVESKIPPIIIKA